MHKRFHMIAALSFLLSISVLPATAQGRGAHRDNEQRRKAEELRDYVRAHYTKSEYMAQMRDGTGLFLSIYAPKDSTQKYPVWMMRTPYTVARRARLPDRAARAGRYLHRSAGCVALRFDYRDRFRL